MKAVRIHYYADEASKRRLICELAGTFLNDRFQGLKWYLKRDWRYGPHIEINIVDSKKAEAEEFIKEIKTAALSFIENNPSNEKRPTEEVLRQLNALENEDGPESGFLPIEENGSVVVSEKALVKGKYFSSDEEYIYYITNNCDVSKIMVKTIVKMQELTEKEQYLLLVALFARLAKQYPNGGLIKGCVSFKSHIIGFLSYQDERTAGIKANFERRYELIKEQLYDLYDYDFNIEDQEELLKEWEGFFEKFISGINYTAEKGEAYRAAAGFDKESQKRLINYSEFHNKWVNRQEFADFFYSEEFYKYRLLVNFFYLTLPCMGFGPSGKHFCCYMITRLVEEKTGILLIDQIKESENKVIQEDGEENVFHL
ncbi:MAG: hypothetical protein IKW81_09655 [Pseudobutyrivibrio sp.]|nr:hypothetical protein [Pseudobutyrivibrio sp.]